MKRETKIWLRKHWSKVAIYLLSFLYMFFGNRALSDSSNALWFQYLGVIIFCGGFIMFSIVMTRVVHWLLKEILTDFIEDIIDKKLENKLGEKKNDIL